MLEPAPEKTSFCPISVSACAFACASAVPTSSDVMQAAQAWYAQKVTGKPGHGQLDFHSWKALVAKECPAADIQLALDQYVESLRALEDFAGTTTTCLCAKTATPTTKIVVSTRGDDSVPIVNIGFELLRSIAGAVPKCGRAPKTDSDPEISSRLDKRPHVPVKGKGKRKGKSST